MKKSFQKECEKYFKRGQKNWTNFFDKWEAKAMTEEIEEVDHASSDDDTREPEPPLKKRKRPAPTPLKTRSKKKKREVTPEPESEEEYNSESEAEQISDSEAIEETITLEISTRQESILSYLSEISRNFTEATPFYNDNFSVTPTPLYNRDFSVTSTPLHNRDFSVTPTPFHNRDFSFTNSSIVPFRRSTTESYYGGHDGQQLGYSNAYGFSLALTPPRFYPKLNLPRSYDTGLTCSTPMNFRKQLCLPSTSLMSPIAQSPSSSVLTIVDSDYSDDDEVPKRKPVESLRSLKQKAVLRCLADASHADDDCSEVDESF